MQLNDSSNPAPIRPQNLSCPAGGIDLREYNQIDISNGQRGVIVAPPSGNTHDPEFTVLHRGFDTLALAIEANIGPELYEFLKTEKARAEEGRAPVLIEYNGTKFHLNAHGGQGYSFVLSGGRDGATWFLKKPNSRDTWGIRLSFGSYFMAMHGLGAAKAHVEYVMERLGIRYGPHNISISRVDFCVDILAHDFTLIPEQFVMHSSTGRRDYISGEDTKVHGKSGRTTSVTIGSSRNRQVILYDKSSEITSSGKQEWWDIWGNYLYENSPNYPKFLEITDNSTPQKVGECIRHYTKLHQISRIWRVEYRAGKDLLKDRWGIRTWEQLFNKFGDLAKEMGEVVRYTIPALQDENRARWPNHPMWEIACGELNDDLLEMRSGADPNPMKEVHREQQIGIIFKGILGCSISHAALTGVNFEDLPNFFEAQANEMKDFVNTNVIRTKQQLQNAKDRYVFVTSGSANGT